MDQAVCFGDYQQLVGVISEPQGTPVRGDTAVLFVTPGMLHSAGPFRLHVELARQAADAGLPSLRFDLSGIGESFGVGGAGRSLDRAATEIGSAMDLMHEHCGASKFILFGLCSGADDALHAAQLDSRVAGVIAMDGCGYRTGRFRIVRLFNHYARKLMDPRKIVSAVCKRIGMVDSVPVSLQAGSDVREFPGRQQSADDLQALVNRGVQLHFLYTGGVSEYYNYADQFFDMFPGVDWDGLASTSYHPEMDHVAFLREDRDVLVAEVTRTLASFVGALQPNSLAREQVRRETSDAALTADPVVV